MYKQCIVALTVLLCVSPAAAWQFEAPPIDLVIDSERMINNVDQSLSLVVFVRNVSAETIELLEPAIDRRSMQIEFSMPDGKKERLISVYGLQLQKIALRPQQRIRFDVQFTPEQLGVYAVRAHYYGLEGAVISSTALNVNVVRKAERFLTPTIPAASAPIQQ